MTEIPPAWRRRSRLPSTFLAGLLVGAVIAALAIPRHGGDGTGSSALTAGGTSGSASAGAVTAGEGSGAGGDVSSGAAADAGAATAPTGGAAGASAGGTDAGQAAAAPSSGAQQKVDNKTLPNGGATFRGVTADKITIGFANLDSSSLASVCPRCGNSAGANGAAANALVAAWRKDGTLPVNGRDIDIVNIKYNVLSTEEQRSACLQMAQKVKPFLVGGVSMQGALIQCLAQENHLVTLDGQQAGDEAFLRAAAPYAWQIQPSRDRVYRNWPVWSDKHGLLKNQVIGLYSPDDSVQGWSGIQGVLDRTFRAELQKLGYKLAVDLTYGQAPNDGLAVQRFRSAKVTVAFIIGALTEPSGFQNTATQQGYRPSYPVAEIQNETTDAVADVSYNANAQDGNLAMKTQFFDWSARKPATPLDNAQASSCVKAYQDYTHRTMDVYDNDAELHYLLEICSILQVAREAILKAGPNLTESSFLQALYQIRNFQTAYEPAVSYTATKHDGGDMFADAKFNKARWQPSNDYWKTIGPWTPFYLP